tara:strand:+ start:1315 stop:2136 length:822 start_codon:yes stop_codon:yes gene_type:complete
MRKKHNKKRNTIFLFELLNRACAKSVVHNNANKKKAILDIIRESFKKGTLLYKEIQIYNSILETKKASGRIAEKTLFEAKKSYNNLPTEKLFLEQSALLKRINTFLDKDVYSYFIPNYKNMATLYQVFNMDLKPKDRVLLEESVIQYMTAGEIERPNLVTPTDKLTFKVFLENFNSTYGQSLLKEQKELLNNYIISYDGSSIELKVYLNEELKRLRSQIQESIKDQKNSNITDKLEEVLKIIDGYQNKKIDRKIVEQILGIQSLVSEITNHDN